MLCFEARCRRHDANPKMHQIASNYHCELFPTSPARRHGVAQAANHTRHKSKAPVLHVTDDRNDGAGTAPFFLLPCLNSSSSTSQQSTQLTYITYLSSRLPSQTSSPSTNLFTMGFEKGTFITSAANVMELEHPRHGLSLSH